MFGNTLGLFVDILPFLERKTQEATLVAFNSVHDNDRPNMASPDDLLGVLPPGLGILIAGGRDTTVAANERRASLRSCHLAAERFHRRRR